MVVFSKFNYLSFIKYELVYPTKLLIDHKSNREGKGLVILVKHLKYSSLPMVSLIKQEICLIQ